MAIKRFGDLVVGDVLEGTNGSTTVVKVYDEHIPEKMYQLEFDDGSLIEVSGNHLWYIETDQDIAFHKNRVRYNQKIFKNLSDTIVEDFSQLAELNQVAEVSLVDMIEFSDAVGNQDMINCLIRIAESIGHIIEENESVEDLATGEVVQKGDTVRLYDSRLFCQQILALKDKKFRKKYPVIVGRVITTERMALLSSNVNIPVIKNR